MSVSLPHWDVSVRSSRPSTVAPAEPGRGRTRSEEPVWEGEGQGEGGGFPENLGGSNADVGGTCRPHRRLPHPLRPARSHAHPSGSSEGLFDPVFLTAKPAPSAVSGPESPFAFFWFLPILFPSAGPCNLLVLVKNALVACGLLKWFR